MSKSPKVLIMLVLSVSLVSGTTLMGGCIGKKTEAPPPETPAQIVKDITTQEETPNQTIKGISPEEAFTLIQENKNNPDFIIIDIQAPEYFANGHIENATNIYYSSETFRDELDKLDKSKTYLVYYTCRCGDVDTNALYTMKGLGFTEVYNISGGLVRWASEGLPVVK